MARTAQDIFNSLITEKNNEPNLAALNSTSNTAIWRLWLWLIAVAQAGFENVFDAFKIEVNTLSQAAQVGNALWYRDQVLQFQYGDALSLVNDRFVYPTIDANKNIVAKCAVVEQNDSSIRIKVAKFSGINLTALTTDEQNALISYVKKIRFAGTRFQVFSNNGDILNIGFSIYYDPIITPDLIKTNVETAIKNYVVNLPFNGELVITKLIDEIQKITGVSDVIFVTGFFKTSSSDPYVSITRSAIAAGGYFNISTTVGETLSDTINYISI